MHEGRLTRGQLQAWALNRYYYQSIIPVKDSIILSKSDNRTFRVAWRKRVIDHDGDGVNPGGMQKWLKLAEATGLSADRVASEKEVLPATRYAGNEYLNIVRSRNLVDAVASSLTELFSKDLITLRMEKLRQHYPWLSGGLDYFEARLDQAPEDAAFALEYVFSNARTRSDQESAIQALRDKCDILWAQLDALYFAYVNRDGHRPAPFAFRRMVSDPLTDSSIPRLAAGCKWGGTEEIRWCCFRKAPFVCKAPAYISCNSSMATEHRVRLSKNYKPTTAWRRDEIREDVVRFLEQLQEKRIVDF